MRENFFFFFCVRASLSGSLITFRNGFDYPIVMERETLDLFDKLKILTFTGLVTSLKKINADFVEVNSIFNSVIQIVNHSPLLWRPMYRLQNSR